MYRLRRTFLGNAKFLPSGQLSPSAAAASRIRDPKGFSLIELLIVVAIILIIAAIAIPSLLRARIAANEASAVGSLRALNAAQITYESTYPTAGYATVLSGLAGTSCTPPGATGACLIDTLLAGGRKSGYSFSLTGTSGTPTATYQFIALPLTPNQTGVRYFCSFADAVVRVSAMAISICDGSVSALQ
jgi:prepilin-type N-terminal cleavage/methylation domain-containing protein